MTDDSAPRPAPPTIIGRILKSPAGPFLPLRGRPDGTRDRLTRQCRRGLSAVGILAVVAVDPAVAQATGDAFCETMLAETIRNLFTVIQLAGPLIGGLLALGATVTMPVVRKPEAKKNMQTVRNQGVVWGVIVAPLGTTIIQFLLSNVVAGGVSCGF